MKISKPVKKFLITLVLGVSIPFIIDFLSTFSLAEQYITTLEHAIYDTSYRWFMDETYEIKINYENESDDHEDIAQQIRLKMNASLKRDLAFKITHVGIHRDDAKFTLNGFDVSSFASQGQKRMLILALKMAILEFIVSKINTYPILLLDDVFSELDTKKKDKFAQLLPKDVQILITTTDINEINGWPASETEVFIVKNGIVAPFKEDYR